MHPHPLFRTGDVAQHEALVERVGFGMVFLSTPDGPRVAHTPLVTTGAGGVRFHLSNRNALTPHLVGANALLLVNGPDGYVSPRWYAEEGEVPTWNYVALEMEGLVRCLTATELEQLLEAIGERHERRIVSGEPWRPEQVPEARWRALLQGITGFELAVADWRPTYKLSQNKPAATRERIAAALAAEGSAELAATMRELAA
jgi:transcriptional regulator